MKDLTNSHIDRENVINNNTAVKEIYNQLGFKGIMFEKKYRYTLNQVSRFYEVDTRTIERILQENSAELQNSGYEIFKGIKLKMFKDLINQLTDTNVGQLMQDDDNELVGKRATSLSVFTFKALLNIGMLLQTSDKAKEVRSFMLNVVIDVLNKNSGGSTKFINQREPEFLRSAISTINYRQEFTNAVDFYIVPNKFKYGQLTDKIYKNIFNEDSKEYRKVLDLKLSENVRNTMYSEVLDLISSYESGFSEFLKEEFEKKGEKFSLTEAHGVFSEFEKRTNKIYEPLRDKARGLMASRDMVFRDALHEKLKDYIGTVSAEDFNKFLGEKSQALEERLKDNMDVFKRLKDR
ncbi:DNA-binding protein [Flavobacterium acetivorans]|uniref:DNA-binding protein n=1 Tax=Flavobacterium acetivorans TaxID=2893883 RepID=UPI001E308155|nr:DNA-binding protein [Flavobacterium sp. F-29]UFH36430.1 DNA-binding protein [Flavobacterium sp. F-29]